MRKTQSLVLQNYKKWLIEHQPVEIKGNSLRRINVLAGLISAMIRGGQASLQGLGTHMTGSTDLESRVKQAKRWLNSKWTDVHSHYIPYLVPILHCLSKSGRLVFAIDGSGVGKGCSALMISLIWKGRAIPICWVVRQSPKGHFPKKMHVDVVQQLALILNSIVENECQIVLLGDGEFDSWELQKACLSHGWDYVFKTAKDTLISENPDMQDASKIGQLAPYQIDTHIVFPNMYFTKEGRGEVNVVYWHDKRYKNPLYLLTNLEYAPLAEFLYRKRFRIETFFGDVKSRGFHIHKTKVCNPETLFNLLIVAALAFIISILFEPTAKKSEYLPKFLRKDQVEKYSIFQIGLRGLRFFIKRRLSIYFHFSNHFP